MPDSPAPFIHLHTHSAYSLAEGAIKTKAIIKLCQQFDMPAVAVTDTGNLFGALEFAMEAAKGGLQPILGCQIQLGLEGHQLVLLAQTEAGYRNLCILVSRSFMEAGSNEQPHIDWEKLETFSAGLICLSGGVKGPIGQYLLHNQPRQAEEAAKRLKKIFKGRLYIEIQRHGMPEENRIEEGLIDLAYKHDIPLVATNDCYFSERGMYEAHDALLCIAEGRYVTESDRRKVTPEHYFKSPEEMIALFADLPEAIQNTVIIAQRCSYLLKAINPMLPPFQTESGCSETDELVAQSREGLDWRLNNFVFTEGMDDAAREMAAKPYHERLQFELDTIIKMGFPGYFLIVSDFIKWAKDNNIPVGPGRGSGAGSVVAWALKITDLDPLRFNLLFERFLNPERVSMPDFDVDFCQDRREEVIQYVRRRYGNDRVAQIITFGQLKARAVVRDVGRVLQMPYGQVDRIAKMIPNNPANPITLEEALEHDADLRAERDREETTAKLIDIALQLEGLYRHASTHAAGVVISGKPLEELVPLYRDPSSDMPVTQFNMKYIEQAGLLKFDFLGLKTMTVVQKSVEFIKKAQGRDVNILRVPLDDEKTYRIMSEGKTTGVFQVESSGMRHTLMSMKPNRFEDIIALVALYRPGPMDNIPRYIEIKEGKTEPDYMHPKLKPYLEETYGIMVYQEQVMQAAQALAGYTLGGADLLRRAMGKKIQAEMDAQRQKFIEGAGVHSGVPPERASEIFDQIDKFAGYGFNKSHAAAYALISYWTGWLKANYPVEFMAASMTLDMGNTDKLAVFKQELDKMGIPLLPPDINQSEVEFAVEGNAVRYALAALKGIGVLAMEGLIAERRARGPYKSMADLASRIDPSLMNRRQFEQLAAAGAFDSFKVRRAQAFAAAETILRHAQSLAQERASGQASLFGGPAEAQTQLMPELPEIHEWDPLEKLSHEFDAVGFYLSAHPLDTKAAQLERMNILNTAQVQELVNSRGSAMVDMAGVLLKKNIKVSQKSGNKFAFLQLSDAAGIYEVMLFSETLSRARDFLEEGKTLLLKVTAEQREEQLRFTAQDVKPLEESLASRLSEVHIHISSDKPLAQLDQLLKVEGRGKVAIKVYVPVRTGLLAEISLPGGWNFSAAARNALLKSPGIEGIQEL
ncbi:MAG: DNA polymerase III subunit alpha [Micavibrio aeruginosavorus]|uniref:DNA polymerase III subunit alpha n=1 Tax=Micavibrio aeruginosavorus TaxID=349221 RepID=A0A7T5UH77_9BACT|nr:MAG: DNA polymerase III subunit alpha [Micavibrio aeruginosavorus]